MNAVRIRSWHLASGLVSRGGLIHTLCGRWAKADAESRPNLPGNEATCERCAVIGTMLASPDVANDPVDDGPENDTVPG